MFDKSIAYDRASRDFRAELNGQLIGWFASYHAAEIALDQVAYDLLIADGLSLPASQLDDDDLEQGPCDDINIPEPDRPRMQPA